MQGRTRIWVGVGSAVLVGGLSAVDVDQDGSARMATALAQSHGGHMMLAQGGEGGEGGEGGKGGEGGEQGAAQAEGPPAEPDRALTGNLLMMKGHMRVGDELVRAGKWSEALPHFLHPIEELYGEVREPLAERDLAPFGDALDQLSRTVRRGSDLAAYQKQRDAVLARIDEALASVPAEKRREPDFLGGVVVDVLGTAADEYGAAFEGDRVVNVVEYQDSLGFVQETTDLLAAHAAAFTGDNAARLKAIQKQLAELRKAWPSVSPPDKPVMRPGEALALVSGIELEASGLR
jgi:hypothetical protein